MPICFCDPGYTVFAELMSSIFARLWDTQYLFPSLNSMLLRKMERGAESRRQHGKAASRSLVVGGSSPRPRCHAGRTGYIYILVVFGRWQRDQITDTICLTPIGDSHCHCSALGSDSLPLSSLLFQPQNIRQPTPHAAGIAHSCPSS